MKRILRACAATALLWSALVWEVSAATAEGEPVAQAQAAAGPVVARPVIEPWGYPLSALDRRVRPGDDFFRFANGGWLDATVIPPDRTSAGFNVDMSERNEERIDAIIGALSKANVPAGSNRQKIRDLYRSYMDVARIEAAGLDPLKDDLARIAALSSHEAIARAMGDPRLDLDGPFALFVTVDGGPPRRWRVAAAHSGLGLPDKSYYLRDEPRLKSERAAYEAHIGRMFALAGFSEPAERARRILALETEIAKRHWELADRRDAAATRNPMTLAELATLAPDYPWAEQLKARRLSKAELVIVQEKSAFAGLARLFRDTPTATWRDYLAFRLLSARAPYLASRFDEENFAFFGKVLNGQQEQRPREKRAIGLVNGELDQAVGEIYIDAFFPAGAKEGVAAMVADIRAVLAERIATSRWMGPETKARAAEKLAKMSAKIAYPDKWRDFSALYVAPGDLVGNIKRLRAFEAREQARRLDKPVDPDEWFIGPQTVNAFYSPERNEIYIPAGYIQSPLYDPKADTALNYGALGSIIGHEIGHGFDDQGSKYDGDGVLRSWWTAEDRARFEAEGEKLVAQYNAYEPLPGLKVNGRATLGENIGDLAGMILTYHAWKRSAGADKAPILDGFTGAQRVFLGRAQARRLKRTEAAERRGILSGVHSPHALRVNGVVRNMDEWYDAFGVREGETLYLPPADRVRIW
jgi:predicted metalloendopeptidase